MRNFKEEDFDGAGQYLVRTDKDFIRDAGYLSTLLVKVGWVIPNEHSFKCPPEKGNVYSLTDMSDGLTMIGFWDTRNDPNRNDNPRTVNTSTWIWNQFDGKKALCDYLNNPDLCQSEFRFATHDELIRVAIYQKTRCK